MMPKPLSGASKKVTYKSTLSLTTQSSLADPGERLRRLNNEAHVKLQNLRRMDMDCADTVLWLRENQRRFRLPILEPPCLSISLKDQRYINAVDTLISHDTMKVPRFRSLNVHALTGKPLRRSLPNATKTTGS